MDWEDVRLFLTVVRSQSFTRAAAALGQHQSTVSRRVGELEQNLGGRLFQRSARSFTLTPLAERLIPDAEAVAAAVERFRRSATATDQPAGIVRLATAEELASELLVPALGELWAVAPEIDLVLDARFELVDIGPGGADVALRVVRPQQAHLRFRKVGELRFGVYASPRYLDRLRPGAAWDWLSFDDPEARLPETKWIESHANGRIRLCCRDTRDLARAADDGWGVAILPEALASERDLIQVQQTDLVRPLWLVTHEALADETRVRVVMEWVAATCAAAARR